jgi:hypothetical protein
MDQSLFCWTAGNCFSFFLLRLAQKSGGKPTCIDPELTSFEVVIGAGKAFNVEAIAQVQESPGREGGHAPAPRRSYIFARPG